MSFQVSTQGTVKTADSSATGDAIALRDSNGDCNFRTVGGSSTGGVTSAGFLYVDYQTKTASFSVDESSNNGTVYDCNATSGAITATLIAASGKGDKVVVIQKSDSTTNAVTVDGAASETVDSQLTFTLKYAGDAVAVICDGTNWRILWAKTAKTIDHQCLLNADCVDQAFFIADRPYQVLSFREIHATAGTDGGAVTIMLTKDDGTEAPGAGDDLLTAGLDAKGTANTLQTGTLTATSAFLLLAAGDRLSLDFAGTVTSLAGVVVSVVLRPI
jgi:hypothetical protein